MRFVAAISVVCLTLTGVCAGAPQPAPSTAPVAAITAAATPIRGTASDYDTLLDLIGDGRFVLLGEATHGTHEFYRERARIARRLIEERGFSIIAIEADWQDAYDLNEFIHGRGPASAAEALATFTRFPRWMWRNEDVRELVEWLRAYNATPKGRQHPVGLYGIDLYGVADSIEEVETYLARTDRAAAARARERYECFARYRRGDMQEYGRAVVLAGARSCAQAAAAQFEEMTALVDRTAKTHRPDDDALISAWQSARVVMNGEAYYRTAFDGGVSSWNLRDRHMADTIDALSEHLSGGAATRARTMVWAHNSHLGDARLTERTEAGELNVGQLMRQRHDGDTTIVGLTTYQGKVRAASEWGGGDRERNLTPALPESYAAMFHQTGMPAFVLILRGNAAVRETLAGSRLQRFVGVIYVSATERQSHYMKTDLARQYDAVIHIDTTTAVEPIGR